MGGATSIALVALVAFAGLVLPCFCSDNAYLELSEYLEEQDNLEDSVQVARGLIDSGVSTELKALAEAFSSLVDGEDWRLCDGIAVKSLRILVQAAIKYRKNSLYPDIKRNQLDRLLINLKDKVHFRCCIHIVSEWSGLTGYIRDESVNIYSIIDPLNRKIPESGGLIENLILYRPEGTEEFVTCTDKLDIANIVFETLVETKMLRSGKIKSGKQAKDCLQQALINKCSLFVSSPTAKQTAAALHEVKALDMMKLPAFRGSLEFIKTVSIPRLYGFPAYLVCVWLVSRPESELEAMGDYFINRLKGKAKNSVTEEYQRTCSIS